MLLSVLVLVSDINECSTDGIKLCPPPQICHNTEGSYYCGCTADHRLQDGHCVHDPCDEGYQILNDTCQGVIHIKYTSYHSNVNTA